MDLAKDNWLLTGLLRKKTRCVQLWLNSYQADLQRGEALTELLLDLLIFPAVTLREYTIFPVPNFWPLQGHCTQARNQQPSSLAWELGGIPSVSCDWIDKHIWSVTAYRNMVPSETMWIVFSNKYFLCSQVTWFACALLHPSPLTSDCKKMLIFTGITVATSEPQWPQVSHSDWVC